MWPQAPGTLTAGAPWAIVLLLKSLRVPGVCLSPGPAAARLRDSVLCAFLTAGGALQLPPSRDALQHLQVPAAQPDQGHPPGHLQSVSFAHSPLSRPSCLMAPGVLPEHSAGRGCPLSLQQPLGTDGGRELAVLLLKARLRQGGSGQRQGRGSFQGSLGLAEGLWPTHCAGLP